MHEEHHTKKENLFQKPWMQSISAIVVIFGALAGFLFWQSTNNTVFVENSQLQAPIVNLSPTTPGILSALYVKEGDRVLPDAQIALVGSEILTSQTGGIVSSAPDVVGSYFAPGQTVVSIVNDQEMKVVGTVDETGGLKNIATGDRATFTVDAFPGKTYQGVVESIGAVADDAGVLFSISDKRPINKFDVKVRFSISDYPELKSGMSAKITVYTK